MHSSEKIVGTSQKTLGSGQQSQAIRTAPCQKQPLREPKLDTEMSTAVTKEIEALVENAIAWVSEQLGVS